MSFRALAVFGALLLLAGLLLSCNSVQYATGSAYQHCDSLTREEVDAVELAISMYVCPKIKKRLGDRPCTPNLVNEVMQEMDFYWHGTGIDYCAAFLPPED